MYIYFKNSLVKNQMYHDVLILLYNPIFYHYFIRKRKKVIQLSTRMNTLRQKAINLLNKTVCLMMLIKKTTKKPKRFAVMDVEETLIALLRSRRSKMKFMIQNGVTQFNLKISPFVLLSIINLYAMNLPLNKPVLCVILILMY